MSKVGEIDNNDVGRSEEEGIEAFEFYLTFLKLILSGIYIYILTDKWYFKSLT